MVRRPEQQSCRNRFPGSAFWIPLRPANTGKDRVIDTVEFFPATDGGVPLVALDKFLRKWFRVNALSEIHTEALNDRFCGFIDNAQVKCLLRDTQPGLHLQWCQHHGLHIVREPVF